MSNYITDIQVSGVTYTLSGQSSGATVSEVTQAQYDALVSGGTVDPTVLYIITDAQAGDLTQYWTSAQTQSAITQATSGKIDSSSVVSSVTSASTDSEIPTAKAVYDAIPTGGTGGSYTAGRGIDITNDTISFSLPISAGTGADSIICGHDYGNDMFLSAYTPYVNSKNSFAFGSASVTDSQNSFATGYLVEVRGGAGTNGNFAQGYMTLAKGNRCHSEGLSTSATSDASHSEGHNTIASGNYSHSEGEEVKATNVAEHSQGRYNVSSNASTTFGDSGNTLFSVGNGTSNSARHNAFEIRQNGDIYFNDGTSDVKLQEVLNGKQDTLVSGTNIKTINNESILGSGNITIQGGGGGGSSYSAGTNIDITNNTISCTLPIREGSNSSGKGIIVGDSECTASGLYGISLGHSSDANGNYSFCNGSNSTARGQMSFAYGSGCDAAHDLTFMFGWSNISTKSHQYSLGKYVKPKNELEFGFGTYNNSSSASTTFGHSGNTLFSIGNGYDFSSTHNWHNALEVRQNGDIYVPNTDDTSVTGDYAYSLYPMVRLQDTITATAANTTALGGLKLVKLTQSAYDALSPNYDSNTLYIIKD